MTVPVPAAAGGPVLPATAVAAPNSSLTLGGTAVRVFVGDVEALQVCVGDVVVWTR